MTVITVEMCCSLADRAFYQSCEVAAGTSAQTLFDANQAALLAQLPELADIPVKLGIHSRLLEQPADYQLQDGDRLEVYRPLVIDPKAARRQRADKAKRAKRAAEQAAKR